MPSPLQFAARLWLPWRHRSCKTSNDFYASTLTIPTSVNSQQSTQPSSHEGPSANFNPLRAHPVEPVATVKPSHKFSYPFRPSSESSEPAPLIPQRRRSRGLNSYRTNKKIPLHLRRQPSLETIASVTTTASSDYYDPPEAEAPCPDFFTLEDEDPDEDPEDDPPATPTLTDITSKTLSTKTVSLKALSSKSSSGSSRQSSTPAETPLGCTSLDHHSPQSLFRKMMPRRPEETSQSPTRLVIEREVRIDRTSHPSRLSPNPSSSTMSLPQRRSPESGLITMERSNSKSSSEWSASGFDTSGLTEAELKRCRKKGINPALYAEMRAAKKGKWTSPIAGNTFL
ncbi:hypothetical protein T440DRAFT_142012 [Plenodomus tracheiphilus IPT5]|uniref:Uncharacterized protein n=1 Tax=Plenodomus tracheiphilus IPT5 TaxID=1408161 RepID=A0A6A7B096_9PLEO|nr:hypothetical protein T440DRAFT_142012 [Plenodomus tracheiphilus IPT5]